MYVHSYNTNILFISLFFLLLLVILILFSLKNTFLLLDSKEYLTSKFSKEYLFCIKFLNQKLRLKFYLELCV